jgi:hypothetical protein
MREQRESLLLGERELGIGKNIADKPRTFHAERQKAVALFPEPDVNGTGFFKRLRIEISAERVTDRMERIRGDEFVMESSLRVGSNTVVASEEDTPG